MDDVDIVIPVYNEGDNILRVMDALRKYVKTPYNVLICYDEEGDNTLTALSASPEAAGEYDAIKNHGRGAHAAVMSGFAASTSDQVIVIPADDDYNASSLDRMVAVAREGADIVCASRFIEGGYMKGCPWLKNTLVRLAAITLHHLARLPTHDPTNGFRLFSRRVLEQIPTESSEGFSYSIEIFVKTHRLGWPIKEVPAIWAERSAGSSRFRVIRWIPAYLRWYFYAFATTYFHAGPDTIKLKQSTTTTEP